MADQTIHYTEKMVGSGHPSLSDTLNRLTLVGHNSDGSHKGYVEASQYGDLAATLLAVPTTTTIVVTDTQTLTGPLTIAHNIKIEPSGVINVVSGTVTFTGSIIKGNYSGFAGAGSVVLPSGGTYSNQDILVKDIVATNIVISGKINESLGTNIASATTTDIGASTGNYVKVTGTTTITALGTVQAGSRRIVEFTDALLLTHNATSLILPNATNITTVAGDVFIFVSLGSGNWKCIQAPNYFYRSNEKIIKGTISAAGAIVDGTGFTVTSYVSGVCTIAFTVPFAVTPIISVISLDYTTYKQAVVFARSTSGATIRIDGAANIDLSFIAIG